MNATRKTAATGAWWLVSLLLVAWGAAPVGAEDASGAPPQGEGVYDTNGGYLGRNMEEAQVTIQAQMQAERQAQIEAFQATHPDPGNGSGLRDMQGRYMGENFKEAAEAGLLPGVDPKVPYDVEGAKALAERHGADRVYINEQTGDAFTYGDGHGNVVTKEEFFATEAANNARMNAAARGMLGGLDDPAVDSQTKDAIRQTQELIEKAEREQAEDLQRQRAEAKKYVPARVFKSFEASLSQSDR